MLKLLRFRPRQQAIPPPDRLAQVPPEFLYGEEDSEEMMIANQTFVSAQIVVSRNNSSQTNNSNTNTTNRTSDHQLERPGAPPYTTATPGSRPNREPNGTQAEEEKTEENADDHVPRNENSRNRRALRLIDSEGVEQPFQVQNPQGTTSVSGNDGGQIRRHIPSTNNETTTPIDENNTTVTNENDNITSTPQEHLDEQSSCCPVGRPKRKKKKRSKKRRRQQQQQLSRDLSASSTSSVWNALELHPKLQQTLLDAYWERRELLMVARAATASNNNYEIDNPYVAHFLLEQKIALESLGCLLLEGNNPIGSITSIMLQSRQLHAQHYRQQPFNSFSTNSDGSGFGVDASSTAAMKEPSPNSSASSSSSSVPQLVRQLTTIVPYKETRLGSMPQQRNSGFHSSISSGGTDASSTAAMKMPSPVSSHSSSSSYHPILPPRRTRSISQHPQHQEASNRVSSSSGSGNSAAAVKTPSIASSISSQGLLRNGAYSEARLGRYNDQLSSTDLVPVAPPGFLVSDLTVSEHARVLLPPKRQSSATQEQTAPYPPQRKPSTVENLTVKMVSRLLDDRRLQEQSEDDDRSDSDDSNSSSSANEDDEYLDRFSVDDFMDDAQYKAWITQMADWHGGDDHTSIDSSSNVSKLELWDQVMDICGGGGGGGVNDDDSNLLQPIPSFERRSAAVRSDPVSVSRTTAMRTAPSGQGTRSGQDSWNPNKLTSRSSRRPFGLQECSDDDAISLSSSRHPFTKSQSLDSSSVYSSSSQQQKPMIPSRSLSPIVKAHSLDSASVAPHSSSLQQKQDIPFHSSSTLDSSKKQQDIRSRSSSSPNSSRFGISTTFICQCCFETFPTKDNGWACDNYLKVPHMFCTDCVRRYLWSARETGAPLEYVPATTASRQSQKICRIPCFCVSETETCKHVVHVNLQRVLNPRELVSWTEYHLQLQQQQEQKIAAVEKSSSQDVHAAEVRKKSTDTVENPMSKAMEQAQIAMKEALTNIHVRSCPKCQQAFVKSDDGCNKMICPKCRTTFCFLCRQIIPAKGYDHFDNTMPKNKADKEAASGRNNRNGKCRLWTDESVDQVHDQEQVRRVLLDLANQVWEDYLHVIDPTTTRTAQGVDSLNYSIADLIARLPSADKSTRFRK